jgi:His/Glu/Gln/Arg/opine family amino acid ABC transporter permease subunit
MGPIEVLWEYREAFANGILVTLQLFILTSLIGTVIGLLLGWLCHYINGVTRRIIDAFALGLSSIPALVILFWLYYPAQSILGISLSPFLTALSALVIMNSFAVYRIASDAIGDFPKQYVSTALVCGMKSWATIRYIQAPLLFRATIPRWMDQQVVMLQTSVFASLISVEEIFRASQRINSVVYEPVIIYTSMALVFLITAGSAIYAAKYLRQKFHRDFSER